MAFRVWNERPTIGTPTGTGSAGSGWSSGGATKNSFGLKAWYTADESDRDFSSLIHTIDGISLSATNTVTIMLTASLRQPHHYSFYYQNKTAWDGTATAIKIGQVNGNVLTISITSPSSLATLPAEADTTIVYMNHLIDMPPTFRKLADRMAGGDASALSYSFTPKTMQDSSVTIAPMVDRMRWMFGKRGGDGTIPGGGLVGGQQYWGTILKWILYGLPVIAYDLNTGTTDRYVKQYYGILTELSDMNSNMHNPNPGNVSVMMLVEGIVLA